LNTTADDEKLKKGFVPRTKAVGSDDKKDKPPVHLAPALPPPVKPKPGESID